MSRGPDDHAGGTDGTPSVFGAAYADAYDLLYREKDYEAECDVVEAVLARFGDGPTGRLLDLGCGTGGHALPLVRRGYAVTGVDRSGSMLARARAKASAAGLDVAFEEGDLRAPAHPDARPPFDAALMLFAVLGYLHGNDDVLAALRGVRRALRPGGLLLLDAWYGPAVLRQGTGERLRVLEDGPRTVLRAASGRLDAARHCCTVDYRLWTLAGDRVVGRAEERHVVRYFFPLELALFLEAAGLRLLRLGAFPDLDAEPSEATWSFLAVARAE